MGFSRGPDDPPGGKPLNEIPFDPIWWHLDRILAGGHITVISGANHAVTTAFAAHLMACVTGRTQLPDCGQVPPMNVLLWGRTHRLGASFKRIVAAAGGDEARIVSIGDGRPLNPVAGAPLLLSRIEEYAEHANVLVIDLPRRRPGHDAECEQTWSDVAGLCRNANISVLVLCGTKRNGVKVIADRVADAPLAREASLILAIADNMDRVVPDATHHAVVRSQSLICDPSGGYEFTIKRVRVEGADVPVVVQVAAVQGTAEEIFDAIEAPAGAKEQEAIHWIRSELARGPIWVQDLQRRAGEDCMSWRTIRRAQRRAGVLIQVVGNRSIWSNSSFTAGPFGAGSAGGGWNGFGGGGPQTPPAGPSSFSSADSVLGIWGARQSPVIWGGTQMQWPGTQAGHAGHAGQQGQVGFAGQQGHAGLLPPEATPDHVHHSRYRELVEAAWELATNATFDSSTADPKRSVVEAVLSDVAPDWQDRQDIISAVIGLLPDPGI